MLLNLSRVNKNFVWSYLILMWLLIPLLILFKIDSYYISILFSLNIAQSFVIGATYILHISGILTYAKKEIMVQYLAFGGYLVGIIFIYAFLQREHFIYYWDFSAYWNTSIQFNNLLSTDFIAASKQIYASILRDDYSVFPTVFLALPLKFLGTSYMSYVLAIYTCFLYPSCLILFLLCIKIADQIQLNTKLNVLIIFVLTFTFPIMIAPMLGGYLDSIGLIFIGLSLVILFNNDFERLNVKAILLLAACLVLLTFTRRWYGFWIVSFFGSIGIAFIFKWILEKDFRFKQLLQVILIFFIIGASSALFLVIFFNEFIQRALNNNFKNAYSAYYFGDVLSNLQNLFYHYGAFILIIALVGCIGLLFISKTRYISIFLVTNLFITYFLFTRIQSLASQHYYLLTVNVLILFISGVILILNYLSKIKYAKSVGLVILAYLVLCNFLVTFTNTNARPVTYFSSLFSDFKQTPRVRTDIPVLKQMTADLKEISSEQHKVYVLSSSGILNDDILRQIEMPDNSNALPFMNLTHHVDLRDGFPVSFFESDYVVIALPTQYHLGESGQKVVGILAEEVMNGSLKNNFKPLKSYTLDNNVEAIVLKKTSSITKEKVELIRSQFRKIYPDNPDLF
ncbi:hypothetical protein DXC69_07180 [Paenibacillus polymyxa]|uniref:hypothetical protein n=1 Tax=Paenibacillus polymyxa TaxID=1406 RepID=UPI000ECA1D80|nr:hypothetical protein [Paenibacillus polymyxa]RGL38361.1 hypothetical protein DXC69_07180 [Paenibacillus polymyxa]UMR35339.1 hypothetical protein MJ749_22350 [Paenibacillus polymyxa]